MSHFNWIFFSGPCTTCCPFRQIWHIGSFQKIPPVCCTNTKSYNVIMVALSQERYRWLHKYVLERTRLGWNSLALWERKIQKQTLQQIPGCWKNPRTCKRPRNALP